MVAHTPRQTGLAGPSADLLKPENTAFPCESRLTLRSVGAFHHTLAGGAGPCGLDVRESYEGKAQKATEDTSLDFVPKFVFCMSLPQAYE